MKTNVFRISAGGSDKFQALNHPYTIMKVHNLCSLYCSWPSLKIKEGSVP